jgi:CelD/BcsL family acetyltransferase involved in cellulose biosynthesis
MYQLTRISHEPVVPSDCPDAPPQAGGRLQIRGGELRKPAGFSVDVTPQFDFLSEEYGALFARSTATAFQHPVWLDAIYGRLVPQLRAEPLVVTVRDAASGGLVMVLPLLRRRNRGFRTIEFADLGVSDYVAPVASAAMVEAIGADPAARRRIRAVLKPFDMLRIRKLQSTSQSFQRLLGVKTCSLLPMSAYAVPLAGDLDTWRAENISASYRRELDKKSRQLHRKGKVVLDCTTDVETIEATLRRMQTYRRRRFETGDLLQDEIYFDFYRDVAIRGRASLARIYTLLLDGDPIAGAMCLSHQGSILVILTGFDHDNYRSQSLGSLIFEMIAGHGISVGDRELDFTIGDEPYKTLFGARKSPIYQILGSASVAGFVARNAVQHGPVLKRLARRIVE